MDITFFAMLNTPEIIALLVLALIFFGAKKLPEMAKGLGHGIKEFRKATREVTDELHSAVESDPVTPTPRPSSSTVESSSKPYPDPANAGAESEDEGPQEALANQEDKDKADSQSA